MIMIVGRLSNIESYGAYTEDIKRGLDYLKKLAPDIPIGSYTINEKMYVNVMEYRTLDESTLGYEAHRTHLDIHYVLSGKERIKWAPVEDMVINTPYDADRDTVFYEAFGNECADVVLEGERFIIMFPLDGHACQYSVHNSELIKKVVIKILL